jgi:hypothetical protein
MSEPAKKFVKKFEFKKIDFKSLFNTGTLNEEGKPDRTLTIDSFVTQKTTLETGEVVAIPEVCLSLTVRAYSWDIKAFFEDVSACHFTPQEFQKLREFFQSLPAAK